MDYKATFDEFDGFEQLSEIPRPRVAFKGSKWEKFIADFLKSGYVFAARSYEDLSKRDFYSLRSTMDAYARRSGKAKVSSRGQTIYLERVEK